jgi:hypothetical protein
MYRYLKLQIVWIVTVFMAIIMAGTLATVGVSQATQPAQTSSDHAATATILPTGPDLDSQIESLRADARADKVAIITQAMKFSPEESTAFWPIYKKYEADLSTLNNDRVQLIKQYADKYNSLNDADAKTMANQAFDYESRRTDLKKRYFAEFNRQLPATTVAKFFQLENRLDLVVDLALASELPPLFQGTAEDKSAEGLR